MASRNEINDYAVEHQICLPKSQHEYDLPEDTPSHLLKMYPQVFDGNADLAAKCDRKRRKRRK